MVFTKESGYDVALPDGRRRRRWRSPRMSTLREVVEMPKGGEAPVIPAGLAKSGGHRVRTP
jgi:hypothetical protein